MKPSNIDEVTLTPDPRTSYRLFQFGVAGLVIAMAWLGYKSPAEDITLKAVGAVMMVFGAWPALNWARKGLTHFPMFEIFMLTCIPFYAVPLLAGHPDILEFADSATWSAALAMILFQISAIITFSMGKSQPTRSPLLTKSLLPARVQQYAHVGLAINAAYVYVNGFTSLIPYEFALPIRATCMGIGMVSLFVISRRWGADQLTLNEKAGAILITSVQIILQFRELYLISGISTLLLGLIGFVSTSRRLPLLPLLVALPVVALLHNGKAAMRQKYWEEKTPLPEIADLPAYFGEWIQNGLTVQPKTTSKQDTSLAGRLFERASLFQMLCLVTERTPDPVPYLDGESYKYLPAQIIPSALWPNKPSSLQSNVLLAVRYGLVSAASPSSVSIAFGMIAEAYANFGMFGCGLLGVVLGFMYKRVSVAGEAVPQFSAVGMLTILLTAWSFQMEQIFASWFVSLLQAAVVVIGVPMAVHIFFRTE